MKKAACPNRIRHYFISLVLISILVSLFMPASPVIAAPIVTITPTSGAVGTTINISGTVFDSYAGDNIHVFFDSIEIENSPIVIPQEGIFTINFIIPAGTTAGQHWIEVRSETSSTSMIARNQFTVEPTILALDTHEGNVGDSINISGTGFYIDKPVLLQYMNLTLSQIGTETASSTGQFSYQFTIPISPAGYHNIIASNDYGNHAEIPFKVLPKLVLSLDTGEAGDLINACGTGFAGQSVVTIIFGSVGVTIAQTDQLGSFDIDFYVPAIKPSAYDVRAQDQVGNIDQTTFTITAGASLSESIGSTGNELTISGCGFIPGHTITVLYDDVPVAVTVADNNGNFTATFIVPPGGGNHIITVSDGTNTKNYTFSIETDPPPIPILLLPNNESMTKAEAFFDWQDVIDNSVPVTYNLEIASDINFATVILYKTGIETSQYTLDENEVLAVNFKNAPYFWRVKAVDGAGNESEYSEPWVFYVSVPSQPILLLPMTDANIDLPIRFSWQSVTSLSPPVSYNLQIATTPDFAIPLVNKKGLSVTDYLVTEEDLNLEKNTTYFWRVNATDNALNTGEWSAVESFIFAPTSGFPGWATYILIIIGALIAVLLAFRTGRRTAYH